MLKAKDEKYVWKNVKKANKKRIEKVPKEQLKPWKLKLKIVQDKKKESKELCSVD